MSAVARAILDDLTPAELSELAERLRPYLDSRQPDRLLTPGEAAARLNIHAKTLTRAARDGRVPGAERVGRSWRFSPDALKLNPPQRSPLPAPAPARPRQRTRTTASAAIRGQA